MSLSKRLNKLPPKTEYLVAVKAALEGDATLGLRDISRRAQLTETQAFSALKLLTSSGQVPVTDGPLPLGRSVHVTLVVKTPSSK